MTTIIATASTTAATRLMLSGGASPPPARPSSSSSWIPSHHLCPSSFNSLSSSSSSSSSSHCVFHTSSSSSSSHCVFHTSSSSSSSRRRWLCRCVHDSQNADETGKEDEDVLQLLGSDEGVGSKLPTQGQTVLEEPGSRVISELEPLPEDVDYIQELLAIQQGGPRAIGFFGTRNMGFMHQELIEILSYALVITKNHIFTSGASGTNAAVIRGALRAEKPELLTVILPQSLKRQPPEKSRTAR